MGEIHLAPPAQGKAGGRRLRSQMSKRRVTVILGSKVGGYVRPRRLVSRAGGELTPRECVDPEGLTFLCCVARRRPRTAGLT